MAVCEDRVVHIDDVDSIGNRMTAFTALLTDNPHPDSICPSLVIDGSFRAWHKNGSIRILAELRNGTFDSVSLVYDDRGETIVECAYSAGRLHGECAVYIGEGSIKARYVYGRMVEYSYRGSRYRDVENDDIHHVAAIDEYINATIGGELRLPIVEIATDALERNAARLATEAGE